VIPEPNTVVLENAVIVEVWRMLATGCLPPWWDDQQMSKRTRILLITLVWLVAAAWCWAITVSPVVRSWMGRESWPPGVLAGFLLGRGNWGRRKHR
jgi:hypothetical protein